MQKVLSSDQHYWPSDRVDRARFEELDRYNKEILHATKSTQDIVARNLYQDIQTDVISTTKVLQGLITDLEADAKKICHAVRCDPKVKSACMDAICQKDSFNKMLFNYRLNATNGTWKGIDGRSEIRPMTSHDLYELRLVMRKNAEIYYRTIKENLAKIDQSKNALVRFKDKAKQKFKQIRGSEETHTAAFITIALIILLVLTLVYFFNIIYTSVATHVENPTSSTVVTPA
jgi:hypothetical protein